MPFISWMHVGIMWTLGLTLADLLGSLEWKLLMLFQSAVSRGFLCYGGGGCNSCALDLAAALQGNQFKNTHF